MQSLQFLEPSELSLMEKCLLHGDVDKKFCSTHKQ